MTRTIAARDQALRPPGDAAASRRRRLPAWSEVRVRNEDWLLKWEPMRIAGMPDPTRDREAFAVRCSSPASGSGSSGAGYGFGIFVDDAFAGEINVNAVQRGRSRTPTWATGSTRRGRATATCPSRWWSSQVRLRGPPPPPLADRHHPPQPPQPTGGGEAGPPRGGRRRALSWRSTAHGRTTSATPSPPRSGTPARRVPRHWLFSTAVDRPSLVDHDDGRSFAAGRRLRRRSGEAGRRHGVALAVPVEDGAPFHGAGVVCSQVRAVACRRRGSPRR